jgi:uncharacterized coiled-coil protein SlyX
MNLNLGSSAQSLSPRILPKLTVSPTSKSYRVLAKEFSDSRFSNQNTLIKELERRLVEQWKELKNRDFALRKVKFNFEAIVEAHNSEKNKNEEIRNKYMQRQSEIDKLQKMNLRLNELMQAEGHAEKKAQEEKFGKELKELEEVIEKK